MQYELSYWERETFFRDLDVVVLGSGIVGLAAALHLRQCAPQLRVAVLERGPLPVGASTRNAGFACFGSMTELLDDMTRLSEDDVLALVERRWQGLQRLRALVGDSAMDFQQRGGYELFTHEETEVFEACRDRLPHFNDCIGRITGHPEVYRVADEQLPRFGFGGVRHLLLNQAEGQVHTGRMMAALLARAQAAGIACYNGLEIKHLEDDTAGVTLHTAAGWALRAPQVLVATNGFARQLLPALPVQPARNQVLVTKPVPGLRLEGCFHYDRGYFYFRNVDGRVLLGGGRNLDLDTEYTDQFGENAHIRAALTTLLHTVVCPGQAVEIDAWWTGIMGLGPVKRPIVQRVSPRVTVAVRLSGMGVAIGTLVGQEGAEMVLRG